MTWNPITDAEMAMARHVVRWISIVRESSNYPSDWIPSDADLSKSALLERLRSGKEPLDEAPPRGLSCPWYALIEDKGPHYVYDVWRGGAEPTSLLKRNVMVVLQNPYDIVEERSETDFIVRDLLKDTSYRFHLWFDREYRGPLGQVQRDGQGGWFIQNMAFVDA